jgi:precorrin-8X/cobalt-precorrin-8 methylmutase
MEKIIIIGHGSPQKKANTLQTICTMLHASIHPGCRRSCVSAAYLEFGEPTILEAIASSVAEGATKLIVHPYFLAAGVHVTKDIPAILDAAQKQFPEVTIVYTEPLGMHEKLIEIVKERIGYIQRLSPSEIEPESFSLIHQEIDLSSLPPEQIPLVRRVIHATADFEFAATLRFHSDAITTDIAAICAGKNILTDVEMVRAGINKKALQRFGGQVICRIAEHGHNEINGSSMTRAELGIEEALSDPSNNIGIVAIGNAPTALFKIIALLNAQKQQQQPFLVIGVPVGFVKAMESKLLLEKQTIPYITTISRKGGSPVAVALVNALIKRAEECGQTTQ